MSTTVTLRDLRLHGVYAEDVVYLRDCGMTVAPFQGGYRVGNDFYEKVALQVFAREQRTKRGEKQPPARAEVVTTRPVQHPIGAVQAAPPAAATSGASTHAAICPCGQSVTHPGRCWHRRGQSGPTPKIERAPRSDVTDARIEQLERQVKSLRRILGGYLRGERQMFEVRAQALTSIEKEVAQL